MLRFRSLVPGEKGYAINVYVRLKKFLPGILLVYRGFESWARSEQYFEEDGSGFGGDEKNCSEFNFSVLRRIQTSSGHFSFILN